MQTQHVATTPSSQAFRLAAWSYSTTTTMTGEYNTLLTLLLWRPGRVSTTTFVFELKPESEMLATVEQALTFGVSGELPLRPLLSTLRALCTGWSMTSQSLRFPKNGIGSTSQKPSLELARQVLMAAGFDRMDGSTPPSPKSAPKVDGTRRQRRS